MDAQTVSEILAGWPTTAPTPLELHVRRLDLTTPEHVFAWLLIAWPDEQPVDVAFAAMALLNLRDAVDAGGLR